jgi:glycerol-3-phosphate dehydrogenase
MAKMTVDRLVEREAREAPCRTHEIPLGQPVAISDLPRVEGVAEGAYSALARRYGYAAHDVLAIAGERGELAQPIVAGSPDLLAEAALAARREQAHSVGDVLLRRTRLGLLDGRELAGAGAPAPERVAQVLARELGWEEERLARELEAFAVEAHAEGIVGSGDPVGSVAGAP